MSKTILSLILYFIVVGCIKCDYYSSISGLETLLRVENHYMWAIGKHLVEVERLQTELDRLIDELDTEYEKRQQSSEFYYDYPVNAFKAINRIAADWQEVFKLTRQIENLTIYNKSSHIPEDAVTLPTDEDLRGAARGLSRLQQLYKLDITNITDGYLRDRKYSSEMSAFNCYILGKSLYESEEYLTASEWLIEALEKSEKENEKSNNAKAFDNSNINGADIENTTDGIFPYVSIAEILEFLAPALFYAGKHELALAVNSKLVSLEPDNSIGLSNRDLITAETKIKRRTSFIEAKYDKSEIQELYEQTCSGELEQRIAEKSQLHCHFTTKNVSYYLLGPLKMEELNTDPFVAVYHDVIYDKEIKEIIARSKSDIERSTIGSEDNSDINEVRISKNSWLAYDSALMAKISRRVADITGLSMNMSEDMQVANYGIGGYYGTHYDFSENPEEDNPDDGNRILTAMFYLNDVDLGGATAFPHLRLAVPPIKHSLVVWYNLHRSLEPDFRTAHAGCPVLKGSKWIGNIWFHAVGQELIRPCDLKPDHDISKPHMAMGVD